MRFLSIKNFEKHQHYKDRNPPWIKLHRSTLSDYAFGRLQDASKAHLMLLWLLASGVDNKIPYDLPWIQKQIDANDPIDVEELILQGFIEVGQDDSKPLAPRKQNAPLVEESRGEAEKRKKLPSESGDSGPKSKSKYPSFPVGDSNRLHKVCITAGHAVDMGFLRKSIAPLYPASGPTFGIEDLEKGLEAFFEAREGQSPDKARFWTLLQFAQDAARWVRLGQMPRSDVNGVTERGRLAVGL